MQIAALILSTLLVASILSTQPAQAVALGQPCDSNGAAVCDRGLWCEPPTGMCTATAGICVAVPRLCVARKKSKSFQPVCGCNSKTYSSDCFRRAYKVTKNHDGKC